MLFYNFVYGRFYRFYFVLQGQKKTGITLTVYIITYLGCVSEIDRLAISVKTEEFDPYILCQET